ncbi:MAG TPA: T9SS type A sorting domain-containing protein [Ohtaekwangia sp.]|uniref:T9SS type A sorting domain-containing protein n=1 Tax=Ohtaekwangia sp. TaxID=2066019 RepID=UPI002F930EA8
MKSIHVLILFGMMSYSVRAQEFSDRQKWNDLLQVASTQTFPYAGKIGLAQNSPNPFSRTESTTIRYQATDIADAMIVVYDNISKEKVLVLNDLENIGAITINGNQLPKGTYIYALFVNGRIAEKKKMVITD